MDDVLGYAERNVVVTGAASGMGEATVRILINLGARVTTIDINPVSLTVGDALKVDLRDKKSIDEAVAKIDGPIDGIFNCAGLPGPPFSDVDVMTVNFLAVRYLIESLLPRMHEGAAIAVVASVAGAGWQRNLDAIIPLLSTEGFEAGREWCEANPDAIAASYIRSKQVLDAWIVWRANELMKDHGIRLNCINPGPTATPMMPLFEAAVGKEMIAAGTGPIGRLSEPEEQAWPLVFLNSPRASYVAGEIVFTDGGLIGARNAALIDSALGSRPPVNELPTGHPNRARE